MHGGDAIEFIGERNGEPVRLREQAIRYVSWGTRPEYRAERPVVVGFQRFAHRVDPGRWRPVRPAVRLEQQFGEAGQRRSEEHTSELQSPAQLVCRLRLEKRDTNAT